MNVNADRAEACQCHDCTQARYKSSLQWQLDQVTANTPPPYELTERISPENITKWTVREASTAEQSPEPPCPTCDSREKSKRFHPYVEACTHNNYRHRCADVKCVDSWHEVGSVGESPKEKL